MNKIQWKNSLPYLAVIALFLVISVGYFAPDIFEGKILFQHDTQQGIANGQEAVDYFQKTGERTRWTNSLFGGMPTYQISPAYDTYPYIRQIDKLFNLYLPSPAGLLFSMLLGFFILLKALRMKTNLAAVGAILYTFSSYFLIIIKAGHIWKFTTLAWIPPTIGGIILIYQKRYWLGGIVTALFLMLQILSNHVQMSYYFAFVIFGFIVVFFVDAIKKKELKGFLKSSLVLLAAATIAVCTNISNLYHTYTYGKDTMRGKTELSYDVKEQGESGLEKKYIVRWSYGIGETWSLLVPNVKGGASDVIGYSRNNPNAEWKRDKEKNQSALEKADPNYREMIAQQSGYWGNQPGTSGPVYVGAFVVFLFILGLFIVKGGIKWALLGLTIFSILLSWGQNFMPLTDFFIDYFPMYNKFRAVSSILVIAEFCIPLLAILALKEIIEKPEIIKKKKISLGISIGLTAGITFLFAVMPGVFFSFLNDMDIESKQTYINQIQSAGAAQQQVQAQMQQVQALFQNMEEVRKAIFTADAWRSFFVILVGLGLLVLFFKQKVNATVLVAGIAILCFVDLTSVNKRYLSSFDFVEKTRKDNPFPETMADKMIAQDKTLYFRVFNQTVDPFNDATTSYRHKSVGGYHAAKLRRYQDIITHQLEKRNMEVYNMLNTKYFIVPNQETQQPVAMQNPDAYGNAWFVDEIKWVNNADEEMAALSNFSAQKTAVIDKRFEKELTKNQLTPKDSLSSIVLTTYEPNKLVFEVDAKKDEFAVFSDIYYEGWKATIDGKELPIVRANYILRAAEIPAGKHTLEFSFNPTSIRVTGTIATIALILFALSVIGYAAFSVMKMRKKEDLG